MLFLDSNHAHQESQGHGHKQRTASESWSERLARHSSRNLLTVFEVAAGAEHRRDPAGILSTTDAKIKKRMQEFAEMEEEEEGAAAEEDEGGEEDGASEGEESDASHISADEDEEGASGLVRDGEESEEEAEAPEEEVDPGDAELEDEEGEDDKERKQRELAEAKQRAALERRMEAEAAFFDDAPAPSAEGGGSFQQLHLSRPLLKGVTAMGFTAPTLIQSMVIPVALQGKDVCASARTGSGKTAAFALPFLERLLFRPRRVAVTRVLVLTPTRELAVQAHAMVEKLAQFTDIRAYIVIGGVKNAEQEVLMCVCVDGGRVGEGCVVRVRARVRACVCVVYCTVSLLVVNVSPTT